MSDVMTDDNVQYKMLGKNAHKVLSNMTKKLFPMKQTFRNICLEDIVPDTKDDLIITDSNKALMRPK